MLKNPFKTELDIAMPEKRDMSQMTEEERMRYLDDLEAALEMQERILEIKEDLFARLAADERFAAQKQALDQERERIRDLKEKINLS